MIAETKRFFFFFFIINRVRSIPRTILVIVAVVLIFAYGSYVIAGLILDQMFGGSPETIAKSFYRKWTDYSNSGRTASEDRIYLHDARVLGEFAAELNKTEGKTDPFLCGFSKPVSFTTNEIRRNAMTDRAEVTVTLEYNTGNKKINLTMCAFEKKWRICKVNCEQ